MRNIGAKVIGLALLLVLFTGGLAMVQSHKVQATLVVSAGEAVVIPVTTNAFASTMETAVSTGEVTPIQEGDIITLSDTAAAQLRLNDGSTIDLDQGTVVVVSELVYNNDSFRMRFNLLAGKTFSKVVRLLKLDDAFEIRTPSSTASIRGKQFLVEFQRATTTNYNSGKQSHKPKAPTNTL